MTILLFLLFGLILGAIVGIVVPGRAPLGSLTSMVIGAAGAMVGGLLASALGLNTEGLRSGFFVAVLGAVCWLAFYHLLRRRAGPRGGGGSPPADAGTHAAGHTERT